ncbi:MAG: hypothetical protein ACI9U2_001180 [Bradymonadia bacterium]
MARGIQEEDGGDHWCLGRNEPADRENVMTTKALALCLAVASLAGLTPYAQANLPPQNLSPTACLAEWNLANEAANRLLSARELALISNCILAELRVLRITAAAIRGQGGVVQADFAPRRYSKGTVAAARALVTRHRQGVPGPAWHRRFWLKHDHTAVLASEIVLGEASAVKFAAQAEGSREVASQCSRFCMFSALVSAEPVSEAHQVRSVLYASSKTADMAGVRLGELSPSSRAVAFAQVTRALPKDESARLQRYRQLFAVFIALRAVGDDRHAQLDFSNAAAPIRGHVHSIRTSMNLGPGQRDLRFTREGFFVGELVRMRRL